MEENPKKSEEKSKENEDVSSENGRENMKVWLQENLRMLVSIVIVVVIALGIYAYSKRTQAPVSTDQGQGSINVVGGDNSQQTGNEEAQPATEEQAQPSTAATSETPNAAASQQAVGASKETDTSFVETATKGDGSTKLARRALANYLEKNPDTSLTAEHKIYIEDLLRRQVNDGHLKVGDTREFSKDAIANAIQKSKSLSDVNSKIFRNTPKGCQR